ncbi:MAG TPA: helix-turn-helix transcriptional regulator [Acetobacteraceae bacterium]
MNDLTNAPERMVESLEDELDCALVRIGEYQDIGGEDVPLSLVKTLSEGVNPVRVWREHRGMSQKDLASAAQVSDPLIAAIEAGRKDIPLPMMSAIARALRVDLADLVPWSQDDVTSE